MHLLDPFVVPIHLALSAIADALDPLLGAASVAAALVLITLLVRAALVPLSIRVVRADQSRRSLAPVLDALRRKHSGDPQRLLREQQAAFRDAGISPFAGLLPALAQAPVLMSVYRLCGSDLVVDAGLFGAPLSQHGLAIVSTAGVFSPPALVLAVVVTLLLAVATWSASVAVRRARAAGADGLQLIAARVLPYGTVAFALVAPLAVGLHLLTSTTWAVSERVILPRLLAVG